MWVKMLSFAHGKICSPVSLGARAMARITMLLMILLQAGYAAESLLWQAGGATWTPDSRLPYYSYSGYHYGEDPIPDVPVVTDASNFGVVGDGIADDGPALQAALDATSNGALFIPAGRYRLSQRLRLTRANVVIRGAGEGQTVLFMPQSLSVIDGVASLPYSSGFIEIHGSNGSANLVGMVAVNAQRGDTTLTLDRTPNVQAGDLIRLRSDNAAGLGSQLLDGKFSVGTDTYRYNYFTDWAAEVVSVTGNSIELDRPLRLDARPEWLSEVVTYAPTVQESGVEDLTFEMNGDAKKAHNSEEGFNAIEFKRVAHCWVRRVTAIDADNVVSINEGRWCTVADVTVNAVKRTTTFTGHHAFWVKRYAQENLVTDFTINTRFEHDLSVEGLANGNVFSRGYAAHLSCDHHGDLPYENLFTDIDVANPSELWRSGGASNRMPHAAVRSTCWNFRYSGTPDALPNWPLFNLIALPGYAESTGSVNSWVEPISGIFPANLYVAQLDRRLNGGPPSLPPTVQLTAPADAASYTSGDTVLMTATASDSDGSVVEVQFWVDGLQVGTDTTAPWSWSVSGLSLGPHVLDARAVDDSGVTGYASSVTVWVRNDPPPGLQHISITGVTASADDGNVPSNAIDGDLNTRWSADGDGQWLQLDLGTVQEVAAVAIAFYRGNQRQSTFDIAVSNDAANWTTLAAGLVSSGTTLDLELFDLPDTSARYLRYIGHGNSANTWNSITNLEVYGPAVATRSVRIAVAEGGVPLPIVVTHGPADGTGAVELDESWLFTDLKVAADYVFDLAPVTVNQ